jgi:hypothetical protein
MFTRESSVLAAVAQRVQHRERSKIAAQMQPGENGNRGCTKFRHPPVDELHLIENKEDTIAKKELTYKLAARKNTIVL